MRLTNSSIPVEHESEQEQEEEEMLLSSVRCCSTTQQQQQHCQDYSMLQELAYQMQQYEEEFGQSSSAVPVDGFFGLSFEEFLPVFVSSLNDIALEGDSVPLHHFTSDKSHQQRFMHSEFDPVIDLYDYVARLATFSYCSAECYIISLVYIDRVIQRDVHVSSRNIHRLLLTSVMVAAKFFDDRYVNKLNMNSYFARVGGISTKEMNKLEIEFLQMINYQLHVPHFLFVQYRDSIVAVNSITEDGIVAYDDSETSYEQQQQQQQEEQELQEYYELQEQKFSHGAYHQYRYDGDEIAEDSTEDLTHSEYYEHESEEFTYCEEEEEEEEEEDEEEHDLYYNSKKQQQKASNQGEEGESEQFRTSFSSSLENYVLAC